MGGVWDKSTLCKLFRAIRTARSILQSLMQTHEKLLDEESLVTLMAETKAILNSQPVTTDTISDPASSLPLSPSNPLTIKFKKIMPSTANYSRPDL